LSGDCSALRAAGFDAEQVSRTSHPPVEQVGLVHRNLSGSRASLRGLDDVRLTRRDSLVGLFAGVLALVGWRAGASEAGSGPVAVASGTITCVLTPELTEGPYYIAGEKLRRNITEGKPGAPLTLRLTVVDASTCKPIKDAAVDIWHADAGGVYSGFGQESGNRTFMRGIQRSDAKGVATFQTVYPGWYQGRTVHIHVKVHVGGNVVHTGQLFFADAVTDAVYRRSPYSRRPNRTTRNAADSIFASGGSRSVVKVRRQGTGYIGAITMGVHAS
jgi:protocatechuate 3,4-dioxygenase beta subunit